MTHQMRYRSLAVFLVLALVITFNTVLRLTGVYGSWLGMLVYLVMGIVLVVALRWQASIGRLQLALLLALPFVAMGVLALVAG
jgi:hypothetical protein